MKPGQTIANMGRNPDLETTQAMWSLYEQGRSCTQVAASFGTTRQSVWDRFRRQGLKMRPCPRNRALPAIEFNGHRYAATKDNYFRRTTGGRDLLHWDIWEKHNGKRVPHGHVVWFVDGDRMNLDPDNLDCGTRSDSRTPRPIAMKPCIACGRLMGRRMTGSIPEGPKAYAKRKTCSLKCSGEWKKGRPRGTRMPR